MHYAENEPPSPTPTQHTRQEDETMDTAPASSPALDAPESSPALDISLQERMKQKLKLKKKIDKSCTP